MSERTELGRGKGAAAADPRGNTRQVDGEGPGLASLPPSPPATLAEALIRLQATLPRITRDDVTPISSARIMGWYGVAADIVSERGCVRFDVDRSTVFRCDPAGAVQLAVLLLDAAERAAP